MVQLVLVRDTVAPHVRVADLIAGAGITITWGIGTLTIGVGGGGYNWLNVTSLDNPVTLVPGYSYVASGGAPVAFILPASASFGDSYQIVGNGNLWSLAQNAGQSVALGNQSSTPGVFGNITATMISDCVTIVCIVANTLFIIRSPQGNPTLN